MAVFIALAGIHALFVLDRFLGRIRQFTNIVSSASTPDVAFLVYDQQPGFYMPYRGARSLRLGPRVRRFGGWANGDQILSGRQRRERGRH